MAEHLRLRPKFCGAATLSDRRMPGALGVPESERWVLGVATRPVGRPPGITFRLETVVTLAGCGVVRVLQGAGVVTPCLHGVQDAVSIVAIGAGDQQTAGVVDQLGPVCGEDRVLCEGDRSDEGRVAYARVVVAEKGIDSGEDGRAKVPERAHLPVFVEEPLAEVAFADGDAHVVGVVGGIAEPLK
ncbi:hypothetical protein ACFXGT_28905 [Streptomyces sp. NPDC059352]|uniref:hypothetical protein n=1 Tax=Streptomyces sp. NPDC059352 TaxID=3346810 RepID=UPI0036AA015A